MTEKIDLNDVILKQATLISLYVFCYYSVFYVIRLLSERCVIELKNNVCVLNYAIFYVCFILLLFIVIMFYVFKFFKERVSVDIENQIYVIIFLFYFTCFEVAGLILTMNLRNNWSMLVWLNFPIVLFCSYFYSALKIIYVDLKKTTDKDITATLFSILLFFALNIFGFVQAKEQSFNKNKLEEPVIDVKKK
ncbi:MULTISPECIES: hypothetical protein [Acinetobacter]|uniref:hypothetical protein n=1 Tax=Acinetobacter TaxID=469 RepID=UPI00141B9EDD|nr:MULTISPECIES: hypothetical protein [Acinetobacter]MCS4299352.1 hypothetical protein [Acinetobacter guillouiae]MCW2252804.1 hypothetical protein [Acinetobacter sp. BIGb0204]NII35125.1 hypothetical protein [Acinetobacter sp. BIGb0196]